MNDNRFDKLNSVVVSEKNISVEMIEAIRTKTIAFKNGLCPELSRFFSFQAFGGDCLAYNLTHPEYSKKYSQRKPAIENMVTAYNIFKDRLSVNSQQHFNNFIDLVSASSDIENYTPIINFKEQFEFCFSDLTGLENSGISQRYYLEKELIEEIWNCVIDNLKRHSHIEAVDISATKSVEKEQVLITVKDSSKIDLERFISRNSSLAIYQKIQNYGYIEIQSGNQILDILTGLIYTTKNASVCSEIRIAIKIPLTVKEIQRLKRGTNQ
jgi:hypothetical protein